MEIFDENVGGVNDVNLYGVVFLRSSFGSVLKLVCWGLLFRKGVYDRATLCPLVCLFCVPMVCLHCYELRRG